MYSALNYTHTHTHTHTHRGSSLVSIWADSRVLVVECAVDVGTVVEGAVSPLHGPSPPLVHEVPAEAGERPMLVALVLQEGLALLHSELLEVSGGRGGRLSQRGSPGLAVTKARGSLATKQLSLPSPSGSVV